MNKYSRRVRMFKEGFISVHVFLNVTDDGREFYDTVIYRKIKSGDSYKHVRGTNLKPQDIPVVIKLLEEAEFYLDAEIGEN